MVVRPQNMPAARPMASPFHWPGKEAWVKASLKAMPTALKAMIRPTHCSLRSFSDGTKRGSSTATQNGLV